jgi:uncharacterized protein (UPF0332 family)
LTADQLLAKANQALASAKTLLAHDDVDGACNRAYYAMFDAARAALVLVKAGVPEEIAKTHDGLLRAFSLHLIKTNLFPIALGKALRQVEDFRLVADYKGDPIEANHAAWAVEQADLFLVEITARFVDSV